MRFVLLLLAVSVACHAQHITAPNPNIAAFPAPPSNAVYFNQLQLQSSSLWTVLGGSSSSGGSNTGATAVTFANTSPSLNGSSVYIGATGNGYNAQAFIPYQCTPFTSGLCSSIGHIQADAYIDIVTALQGEEGPNVVVYTGSWETYPSVQCATNSGSTTPTAVTWNLWGGASGWVSTNQSCATYMNNKNVFQHVQWLVTTNFTLSTPTYTYVKLYVQNQPVSLASMTGSTTTFNAVSYSSSSGAIKPQAQVDSLSTSTAAGFYIDSFNVAAW